MSPIIIPIQNWSIGDQTVVLSHNLSSNKFACIIDKDGAEIRKEFEVTRFDTAYAINLVKIFKDVIEMHLNNGNFNSSAFLPVLYTDILKCKNERYTPMTELKVALFGTVDLLANKVSEASWGIFHEIENRLVFSSQAQISEMLTNFLLGAPRYDRPNRHDDTQNYAMTSYAKRFRVIVHYDEEDHIRNIELCRCSLLARDVLLDENNWAVTLVSSRIGTSSFIEKISGYKTGHAMVACEGIESNIPFLRYVHLTQLPRNRNPNLANDEGQVECFDRKDPLDTENGPTWNRPKILVNNMLQYAESISNQPIRFALYGFFPHLMQVVFHGFRTTNLSTITPTDANRIISEVDNNSIRQTCLDFAIKALYKSGVFIKFRLFQRPLQAIDVSRTAPICAIPGDFDRTYLGSPLPLQYSDMVEQMLCSNVILIPHTSTPEEVIQWSTQVGIEQYEILQKYRRLETEVREQALTSLQSIFTTRSETLEQKSERIQRESEDVEERNQKLIQLRRVALRAVWG